MATKLSFRRRGLARYAAAVGAVAAAFLLREGLSRVAGGDVPPYLTFYPAVALIALLGGFGPGMLATLTAALLADYWVLPPQGSFGIATPSDALGLAVFSGMGVFLSIVFELYRRARRKVAAYEGSAATAPRQEYLPQPFGERVAVNAGLILSLAVLAGVGWQIYRDLDAAARAREWETHTYLVIQELDRLLAATEEVETGQRGFIITGEERYLEPYNQAVSQVDRHLATLSRLTQDNPSQQQTLAHVGPVIRETLAVLKITIDRRRSQGFPAALAEVATGKGEALMEEIRRHVAEAQGEEARLLPQRTAERRRSAGRTLDALLAGGTLGILLLAGVFVFLKQENERRVCAEAELRWHRDRLQEAVVVRTAELSRANESLRQEHELLRVTLERLELALASSGMATFDWDIVKNKRLWSSGVHSLLGTKPETFTGTAEEFFQIMHPEDRGAVQAALKRGIETTDLYETEYRVIWPDGSVHHIAARGKFHRDHEGRAVLMTGVCWDITRKKQAEEALREAQAQLEAHAKDLENTVALRTARLRETIGELEHFSYAIVHDMRAPLRAMQGFATLTEEECAGCERPLSKEYFRRIKLASSRMDQLIADSLSYSQAVRQEFVPEAVALFPLIDGLVETYPNLQPDKADIQVAHDLPRVLGNEAALTQCFSNLLGNAVKFAKSGTKPQITVREETLTPEASTASPMVRIWVEDNGVGIPKDSLARIFGMFQRAATDREGTGIGLAIVRKVVERMGGQVGVESEPGQGSRFWVDLRRA